MTNVTVFCSTIPERHHLWMRSVQSWVQSLIEAQVNYTIAVYAEGFDGSEAWPKSMNVHVHHSPNRSGSPEVGSNFLWNKYKDQTDVAIFTHPEIMFGGDVVKQAVEAAQDKIYVTFRPFFIPKYLTEHWNEYRFKRCEDCENCPEMYQFGPAIPPIQPSRYINLGVRDNKDWESDTTWAGNKKTIEEIFPVPHFGAWGPIDCWLAGCRRGLYHTKVVPDACVYHQNHIRIEGGEPGYAVREATKELIKKFGVMV